MSAPFRLLAVSISVLTLNCSSPNDGVLPGPPPPTGNAGTGSPAGGASSGGSGGASVLPTGGGGAGVGGASTSTAGTGTSGSAAGGSTPAGGSGNGGASGGSGGSSAVGPSGPTSGCQQPDPAEEPQVWLPRDITVANLPADKVAMFGQRKYFVRLPVAYDHARAYPVVIYGPGCGASMVESTPMMGQIKNDAIHVFVLQKGNCFSTGYPSPEVPYVTQALDEVQGKYCTDAGKVFMSGYSSGAWLSNVVACALGNRIRGIGTAAGGLRKSTVDGYMCNTPAAGVFYSGENDTENPASELDAQGFETGVIAGRDRLISSNGCDPNGSEVYGPNPICKIWRTGCANNPVLFCVGPGDGHGKGDGNFNVSNKTFWDVWSTLP